jgi:hypothetical protein
MKTETITSSVIKMRNELQPHFTDNVDIMLFDYAFYTALESFIKKEREKAKIKVIDYADKPDDFEGLMIRTKKQLLIAKLSKPRQVFSVDTFIEQVLKTYPNVDKFKLRELAANSKVDGAPAKSYIVEDAE